jgi:hypothetical protein
MDKIKQFHREIGIFFPKQRHLLFLIFKNLKPEIEAKAKEVKKEELIEVKLKREFLRDFNGDEKVLYVALLKVLIEKYKTVERVWEEVKRWKNNHDLLRYA